MGEGDERLREKGPVCRRRGQDRTARWPATEGTSCRQSRNECMYVRICTYEWVFDGDPDPGAPLPRTLVLVEVCTLYSTRRISGWRRRDRPGDGTLDRRQSNVDGATGTEWGSLMGMYMPTTYE